jgi:hypothetical protein
MCLVCEQNGWGVIFIQSLRTLPILICWGYYWWKYIYGQTDTVQFILHHIEVGVYIIYTTFCEFDPLPLLLMYGFFFIFYVKGKG